MRITVVTVLASGGNKAVDERLTELAKEVQKRDPALTGFTFHASEAKSIAPGGTVTFDLIDKQEVGGEGGAAARRERPRRA